MLLITVDTLRVDRLSGYGYERPTSPAADRLLRGGARFDQARTVEPLTGPACSSMLTSLYPHQHGAIRNGLRIRAQLPSLGKELDRVGYRTAAVVGNWTLKDSISGLAEHFDDFEEVLTRRRWLGLFAGEATARDLEHAAASWLDGNAGRRRPFFLWVHYVEPHAPYQLHRDFVRRLGLHSLAPVSKPDRYDTEIAAVDESLGRLVRRIESDSRLAANTLIVFTSDHGESLGEHGEWGHGPSLYEPALRIPLAFYWPGAIRPQRIGATASILDVAPTVLALLGRERPSDFQGYDWSAVIAGRAAPPPARATWFQTHKSTLLHLDDSRDELGHGLLQVGMVRGDRKEVVDLARGERRVFDLRRDPRESARLEGGGGGPSPELREWLQQVREALAEGSTLPPARLEDEDVERLRSLGYGD
ncbi:MAG TPA: sulfatase [Thermoanaerobaculia bacterium]|nr:sulfatase [Thermoanaerobaculia bacterium]